MLSHFQRQRTAIQSTCRHIAGERNQGFYSSGFIVGNRRTSLIEGAPVRSMTSLSTPMPRPPVGAMPYSRAQRKSSSTPQASSSPIALSLACASKRSRWSMGSLSSENAFACSRPRTKSSKRSVSSGCSGLRFARGEISTG